MTGQSSAVIRLNGGLCPFPEEVSLSRVHDIHSLSSLSRGTRSIRGVIYILYPWASTRR